MRRLVCGLAMAGSPNLPASVLGAAVAALLVAALGALLAMSLTRPWGRLALRVAGSWVAALGLMLIALARRRRGGRCEPGCSDLRRRPGRWLLEVVNPRGTSIVRDDQFDDDQAAFVEFTLTLDEEGLAAFANE